MGSSTRDIGGVPVNKNRSNQASKPVSGDLNLGYLSLMSEFN